MTDTPVTDDSTDAPGPEQGGGPPALMPWTLVVEEEGWSADLQHGAPLPRIGDRVEFIADGGRRRFFRVSDVVHTVQRSSSERPLVREEQASPNSIVDSPVNEPPGELRAGLPRVYVSAESE